MVIDVGFILFVSIQVASQLIALQDEVISGLMKSLGEVNQLCFTSKLATKHVLLITTISSKGNSSMRFKAQVLGVHPRKIVLAVEQRRIMDQGGEFLWNLSLRKKRSDVLSSFVKVAIISWWVLETKISPNRKEVT